MSSIPLAQSWGESQTFSLAPQSTDAMKWQRRGGRAEEPRALPPLATHVTAGPGARFSPCACCSRIARGVE